MAFGRLEMWGRGVHFLAATVAVVLTALSASPVSAACAPDPASSGNTVTCSANDGDGFEAGVGVDNLTVDVQVGATVFDNGTVAIGVNDGNTVTNLGTLTAGDNMAGISAVNSNTITNSFTINVGQGSVGIDIGDDNTVTNSGAVNGGIGSTGIFGGANNNITNTATGTLTLGDDGVGVFVVGSSTVTNFGVITIGNGSGGLSSGILAIADGNTLINGAGAQINGGDNVAGMVAQGNNNIIRNAGNLVVGSNGIGIAAFGDRNTIVNSGVLTVGDGFSTGIWAIGGGPGFGSSITNTSSGTINVGTGGVGIQVDDEGSVFNAGTINAATGLFAIQFCNCSAASSLTIAPTSVINGLVLGTGTQVFQLGGTGTGTFDLGLIGAGRQYDGFGTFNKVDASHWIVSGVGNQDWTVLGGMLTLAQTGTINGQVGVATGGAFTNNGIVNGLVTVNGGSLAVNGTVAGTVIVNTGGTLSGIGTVGNTSINGGTLSPGNSIGTLTVQGNLVLSSAATYFVELDPANADRTLVTGTASIAGTVQAVFAAGAYVQRNYTILTANGGLSGTFGTLNIANLPAGFRANLTYDPNNAYVTLTAVIRPTPPTPPTPTPPTPPTPTPPTPPVPTVPPLSQEPFNRNQQNVATSLNDFFNGGGLLPPRFVEVFALTGNALRSGLTQLSGEIATLSPQAAFSSVDYFLNLMLDPFITGRGGDRNAAGGPGANNFAAEATEPDSYAAKRSRSAAERDAYAAVARKAPVRNNLLDPRWSVWGAAYGGELKADGNAAIGSREASTRAFGFAVGTDYRISPDTIVGFAMSGGGTSFSLAQNGGSGRSDVFQAGAFVRHNIGQGYLKGAVAYGFHDVTTDRTVAIAGIDRLQARFDAHTLGARGEAGYRFATPWMGITPYAAAQAITYYLPGYGEQLIGGFNTFALNYAGRDITSARSELGVRADRSFALQSALLTLRGRAAWAHYFDGERSLTATFQTLPGASFVVTGAGQARDAALVSASADLRWTNGVSIAGVFEGEFSDRTSGYAGKGIVRYQW